MPSHADMRFLRRFENCEVSEDEWTHEAHVYVAWILSMANTASIAEERLRAGIMRHNAEVLGRPERYHDTVTVAFARIIRARLRCGETWSDFRRRSQDILSADEPMLLQFYTPERLFSSAARNTFVEPDRTNLPRVAATYETEAAFG